MENMTKRKVGRPRDDGLWARRHEEILEAAAKIFADRGFSKTDLQEVADTLKIGKGTIYRYFPSKQDLLLAAVDWGMELLHQEIENSTKDVADPLERMAKGVYSYLSFYDKHPEFVELLIQERAASKDRSKSLTYFERTDEEKKPWEQLTQTLIEEGRFRNIPVAEISDVFCNLLYGTMFTNFLVGRKKPCEQQVKEILNIVFKGILTESERKRLDL
jgi:AcrR family transcriptional regulator